jgi:5'-nucleotidase
MANPHVNSSSNGNTTRTVVLSADPRSFKFDPRVCGRNCGKVLVVGDNPSGAADLYTPAAVSLAACTTTVSGASGPVVAPAGQVTCVTNATVSGPVTVQPGGALVLTGSTVTGGVVSQGAAGVRICGSQITTPRGSPLPGVSVTGSFGPVVVGDGTPACPPSDIVRGVAFDANQSVRFDGNRISGGVSLTSNGPSVVANNQITLSLDCSNNTPAPTNESRPNLVLGARTGQCAAL